MSRQLGWAVGSGVVKMSYICGSLDSDTEDKSTINAVKFQTQIKFQTCRILLIALGNWRHKVHIFENMRKSRSYTAIGLYNTMQQCRMHNGSCFRQMGGQDKKLEMWANVQRDGRPAGYRWRPLFNVEKFGRRPLLDAVQ